MNLSRHPTDSPPTVEPIEIPDGRFDAYIFDCDGTLADTMPLHFRAWTIAVTERGGVFPEHLLYEWGGTPTREIVVKLNARFGTHLDVDETVTAKEGHFLELLSDVKPVWPVLERARLGLGKLRMAVASGGRRSIVEKTLEILGVRDWFQVVLGSGDYARGKPNPDPFLEAARRLNVSPSACLVFEDTETGFQAAAAAGMQYVAVPAIR